MKRFNSKELRNNLPEHGKYGPSSMKRILKCIQSTLPDGAIFTESSDAAQLGTDAHEAGELAILEGIPPQETLSVEHHGQDTIDAVEIYVDYVNSVIKRCDDSTEYDAQWKIEGLFMYSEAFFGTADFTGIEGNVMWVIDYKNGVGEVDPEENEQGLSYAGLALIDSYMYPDDVIAQVDTINIVIVQPRAKGEDIKKWSCSRAHVEAFMDRTIEHISQTEEEIRASKYLHGEHCFFCPRKINCPHLDKLTHETSQGDVTTMTADELGIKLANASILENRIKSLREYAYSIATKGKKITGWKLVNKRSVRSWTNQDQIVSLLNINGFSDEQVFISKMKSPAQIEKLVGKKDFDDYDPYVTSASSGTTLVKESDRRSGVIPKEAVNNAIDKLKAFNLKNS